MAATLILTMSGGIKSEEFLLDVQQKMNGKIATLEAADEICNVKKQKK